MQTILAILKMAGGWYPGLSLKIENLPYMALVIEAMDESGPLALPALSVFHYGEQNGDLVRKLVIVASAPRNGDGIPLTPESQTIFTNQYGDLDDFWIDGFFTPRSRAKLLATRISETQRCACRWSRPYDQR